MIKLIRIKYISIFALLIFFACKSNHELSDNYRDENTEYLYQQLKKLSTEGKIMYGCANPTTLMYNTRHIYSGFDNSDCKEITGQNPAYYESDFMWHGQDSLKDPDLEAMRKAYERGAVVGYCWHFRGKESNSFYAKSNNEFTADKDLVKKIVQGSPGTVNPELNWFYNKLDSVVIQPIKQLGFPLTFRPWHEMNGNWFWWGSDNCTPEEYVKLYRMTVDHMREQGVRNVLYVWSPDTKFSKEYYPGDDYVDILGLDIYEMGAANSKPMQMCVAELEKLTDYAAKHNKIAAITETGLRIENGVFRYPEEIPDYWTKNILEPIVNNEKLNRLIWVESWYSSDWSGIKTSQFYYPYKGIENDFSQGQAAIDDFLKFYHHPATLFEGDLKNIYKSDE